MAADSSPWAAPDRTLATATSQMGQGAWTRSSISRVNPNSWAMARATDCTPWNMIEIPTTPGTRMVAKAGLGRRPLAPDALADLREHEEEHEAQQERLDQRPQHELAQVLAQHQEVAQDQRPQGGHAGGRAECSGGRSTDVLVGGCAIDDAPSVAELLAGQVDEHRLQGRLGHREVEDREPGLLGAVRRRSRAAGPCPSRAARLRRRSGGSGSPR